METIVNDPQVIINEATAAANLAGDAWMSTAKVRFRVVDTFTGVEHGQLLDACGNAHVQFKDKRSKNYKAFLARGLVRRSGNAVVEIAHKWRGRQEHGLQYACATAAKRVLEQHGITDLRIWDYID